MEIKINDKILDIETLGFQKHENLVVVPIKSSNPIKEDFLSLEKGLDMGIVKVMECEDSTVSEVKIINNAVTPLLIVDGEEIKGAKQNRIINITTIIPPKTGVTVPVSCTEHGRWEYTSDFEYSNYFANSRTRSKKSYANVNKEDTQFAVWDSIDKLQVELNCSSKTSALRDAYEKTKIQQEDYLKNFELVPNQEGLLVFINNELVGFELFCNPLKYKHYHNKILKSYGIDALNNNGENSKNSFNKNDIKKVLNNICDSSFSNDTTIGLGQNIKFLNDYGTGSALCYDDTIVHMIYFKNP